MCHNPQYGSLPPEIVNRNIGEAQAFTSCVYDLGVDGPVANYLSGFGTYHSIQYLKCFVAIFGRQCNGFIAVL